MPNLLNVADRYCQTFNWQKFSLMKLCCISVGIILGLMMPQSWKKTVLTISCVTFAITYVPLMTGLIRSALREDEEMYL